MPFDPKDLETIAAIKAAVESAAEDIRAEAEAEAERLRNKNKELLGKLRKAGDVTPEQVQEAEQRAEAAEQRAADLEKTLRTTTTERDSFKANWEKAEGAGKTFAQEAELSNAIATGRVIPELVPAFKALISQQAKTELVDGKYVVQIGDKSAADYVKGLLESDDGKHFRLAHDNSGGGTPGGGGGGEKGKTVTQAQLEAMPPKARSEFFASGGALAAE